MSHRIDSVTFIPGTSDGPLLCTCGDKMLASQFKQHHGPGNPTLGSVQAYPTVSPWTRSVKRRRAA